MAKYILVGASPVESISLHPGGVLTLSIGLIDYAMSQGHSIEIINTARSGLAHEPIVRRLKFGMKRVFELSNRLLVGDCNGVVVFSGAGLSFYERIILSSVCRWFGVKDLFVIVDGWFLEIQKASFFKRLWIGFLLRIPYKLASTGSRWFDLFRELGIRSNDIVQIHFWKSDAFVMSEERTVTPGPPLRFLFVGWMIKEKGLYELLAAIEELKKRHEFSFIFVGGGPLLDEVRKAILDFDWGSDVSALGWVPDAEFQQILSSADVFVLPSYAEGFPTSLVEAFSRGLPAICTDVGGIADSLRNGVNGFLVPPRQVRPLVEAMEHYLRNPQIIVEHSRAALEIFRTNHQAAANCKLCFDALK